MVIRNNRSKFFLSFASGLVGATVTIFTSWCTKQLVDIVRAAALYFNGTRFFAAIVSRFTHSKADCAWDYTLIHCRMTITQLQPAWVCSTTSVHVWWTCGRHFCACCSLETIPAFEGVVTFSGYRYVGFISFCIGQSSVVLTNINWNKIWNRLVSN